MNDRTRHVLVGLVGVILTVALTMAIVSLFQDDDPPQAPTEPKRKPQLRVVGQHPIVADRGMVDFARRADDRTDPPPPAPPPVTESIEPAPSGTTPPAEP